MFNQSVKAIVRNNAPVPAKNNEKTPNPTHKSSKQRAGRQA